MLKDTIISVPDYSEGFRKELYEKAMKAKALNNVDNKSRKKKVRKRTLVKAIKAKQNKK